MLKEENILKRSKCIQKLLHEENKAGQLLNSNDHLTHFGEKIL